jgi:hypothetical protein
MSPMGRNQSFDASVSFTFERVRSVLESPNCRNRQMAAEQPPPFIGRKHSRQTVLLKDPSMPYTVNQPPEPRPVKKAKLLQHL